SLRAQWSVRRLAPFVGGADPGDRAILGQEDGLRRGGRRVDPEDVTHWAGRAAQRDEDPTRAPWSAVQSTWFTAFSSSSWRPVTGFGSISPDATLPSSEASVPRPSRIAVPSGSLQRA